MTPAATGQREEHLSTRDRIIRLLLKEQQTVETLAQALGVTRNAVRAQIALLQRDRIVEVQGELKKNRRPAAVYGIRADAEVGPSLAYAAVLAELVRVLRDRLPTRQFGSVMRTVGSGMAAAHPRPSGSVQERVDGALHVLHALGARADLRRKNGTLVIEGSGCPISRVVQTDERACKVMEVFLAGLTGLPVTERCEHGERPNCRFEIEAGRGSGKV